MYDKIAVAVTMMRYPAVTIQMVIKGNHKNKMWRIKRLYII